MKKKSLDFSRESIPTSQQLENELRDIRYRKEFSKVLKSTTSSLVVVSAIAVLLSMLILPVLRVTGGSMSPTLHNDDLVICSKVSGFDSGDVVAFYYNNKILLKRVIGKSGDEIDIKNDGTVFVNGVEIKEPYVSELAQGTCDVEFPYHVPDNRIFVMGDNRSVSVDSRSATVGCIADEYVIGKVVFRLFPFDSVGFV